MRILTFNHFMKNLGQDFEKNLHTNAGDAGLSPWRRKGQSNSTFLPGKSHEQRSLVGYSPWSCKRVIHDLATKQQQYQEDILVLSESSS